jgi:hypothetical protein
VVTLLRERTCRTLPRLHVSFANLVNSKTVALDIDEVGKEVALPLLHLWHHSLTPSSFDARSGLSIVRRMGTEMWRIKLTSSMLSTKK